MQGKKTKTVNKSIKKEVEKEVIAPNLVKVLDKITKKRIILDANKEPDYKNKYLHIGWEQFID